MQREFRSTHDRGSIPPKQYWQEIALSLKTFFRAPSMAKNFHMTALNKVLS